MTTLNAREKLEFIMAFQIPMIMKVEMALDLGLISEQEAYKLMIKAVK